MALIPRIYNASVGATRDLTFMIKYRKSPSNDVIDQRYFESLSKKVGVPHPTQPMQLLKVWKKAYNHNVERVRQIELIQQAFKKPSIFRRKH